MKECGIESSGVKMIDVNQDLNILYFGASGGFVFLHWLILLDRHYVSLPNDESVTKKFREKFHETMPLDKTSYDSIKDPSWPDHAAYLKDFANLPENVKQETSTHYLNYADDIDNIHEWYRANCEAIIDKQWKPSHWWKSTECWPDNTRTLQTFCAHKSWKIYFTCNEIETWLTFPGIKILLYTDLKTQSRMAAFKRAWYCHPDGNLSYIQSIKKLFKHQAVEFDGDLVFDQVLEASRHSNHNVKLQTFIMNPLLYFASYHDNYQKKLLSTWIRMHPKKLLAKISLDGMIF
jgi:hypothetical protein